MVSPRLTNFMSGMVWCETEIWREADVAGNVGDPLFMVMMPVPVHEHDGHRLDAVVVGGGQALSGDRFVERPHDVAMSADALGDLGDRLVQQLG